MSATEVPHTCTWGKDRRSCQFQTHLCLQEPFEGRYYCPAHAPLEHPKKLGGDWTQEFVIAQLRAGNRDLSGIVFPGMPGRAYSIGEGHPVTATGCLFDRGLSLDIRNDADLSRATALGKLDITKHGYKLELQDGIFSGDLTISVPAGGIVDAARASFGATLAVNAGADMASLRLGGCQFSKAPQLSGATSRKLPQDTSFRESRFLPSAFSGGTEAKYRQIRNLFHENRDREQEGFFYCLEKRAMRKSLGWRGASLVSRLFSALYDWLAAYGQSYERTLGWFVGVQAALAVIYSWMSAGRAFFNGHWSAPTLTFTLAQVVRPFELLSARQPDSAAYVAVYPGKTGLGWWAFATTAHSVLSISLLALFLLALRWRFRRD